MEENISKLGSNQQKWLEGQLAKRKTYPWLGKIDQIPSETDLEILAQCRATNWNSSCFSDGLCMDPGNPNCPKREK